MNKVAALTVSILLFSCPAVFGQDAMQYGVKHLTVLAEDQKVRVLRHRNAPTNTPKPSETATVLVVFDKIALAWNHCDGFIGISLSLILISLSHAAPGELGSGVELMFLGVKVRS
jgi:hypothetical protein